MKTNAKLFLLLTVFYLVDAIVYGYWTYNANGEVEMIGTAAIGMLVFLSGFIYFYVNKTADHSGALPEDRLDANIEDGDAEIGFFSPWSWWPLVLGFFASIVFASLAVGWWLTFCAVPLALVAVIGLVFEYSRGQHAH
ncbi:MAG: hypothetical protein RLZ69_927 [Actinomycetota bacterium]|jgi:hypothetical protein